MLRLRGIDAITTQEDGMGEAEDDEQLAYATREGRVHVTYDRDFSRIVEEWFLAGRLHAGVIESRQCGADELGDLLRMCSRLALTQTPEQIANTILPLELFK